MDSTLVDVTLLGLGVALNPIAITAMILVLTSSGSARRGYIFLGGWITGLLLIVILPSLLILEAARRIWSTRTLLPPWAWLVVGGTLLVAAILSLRSHARGVGLEEDATRANLIEGASNRRVFGLGATLSLASLRNILLLAAAAALIAGTALGLHGALLAAGIFFLASSAGVLAPVLIYTIGGDRTASTLQRGGDWLQRNLIWLKTVILLAVGAGMLLHGLRLQ